jgi:hypothetical protein
LSRAAWCVDELGRRITNILLPLIPGKTVHVIVDDTLCRKSGPHLWGAAMHHDPLTSTYGRGTSAGRKVFFAFGHNWVILSVWVPMPWNPRRGLAVPVLFRLYRSKKRCPQEDYHKRTQLAADMVRMLATWMPSSRRLTVVGDQEYACKTLLQSLPEGVDFVGPMPMDAALFAKPTRRTGMGRPRLKGERLPTPGQWAQSPSVRWKRRTLPIYGRGVEALTKTYAGLWYRTAGTRVVRVVVTRDPKGRIRDRAYFSTDPKSTIEDITQTFSRRWAQEVMHRDVKQHLGAQDPQNGWWRRPHGCRAAAKVAGPQPHPRRGERAVRRTAPLAFITYALVVIWYLTHGSHRRGSCSARQAVRRVQRTAPWYRHKCEPCFADMLAAARREFWVARLSAHPLLYPLRSKLRDLLPAWLPAA